MISKGIYNNGNTCYLNSVIQCITHLFIFNKFNEEFILELTNIKGDKLLYEWMIIQKKLLEGNDTSINCSEFINSFRHSVDNSEYYFDSFEQNDACEFITILLESFHDIIKQTKIMNIDGTPETELDKLAIQSMKSWINFFKDSYSYIIKKTYSQILTLPVKNNCTSLYDCLYEFTKESKLDMNNKWKCDKCNQYVESTQQNFLWNVSDVLIIQLKLYTKYNKITKYIQYPDYLDISDYNINYNSTSNQYKLYGICCQSGGLYGGHYYSICYNKYDHQWRKYNDSNVDILSKDQAFSEMPYCLFYMKK